MSSVCHVRRLLCPPFVMSAICYVCPLLCLPFVMSAVCYVHCLLCPLFVMSAVCYVRCLLCPPFKLCLPFVMSSACYVRCLLCPLFASPGFVVSSVCLSRVWRTTDKLNQIQIFHDFAWFEFFFQFWSPKGNLLLRNVPLFTNILANKLSSKNWSLRLSCLDILRTYVAKTYFCTRQIIPGKRKICQV